MTLRNPSLFLARPRFTRRQHLQQLATLAAGLALPFSRALACTLAPQMTEGPYWVDEKLNRRDLTTNTTRTSVLDAIPLRLDIDLFGTNGSACSADVARNIQVDIWHCDAIGAYSDASGAGQSNTLGQTFLRGYQMSDASGRVSFDTIYPGWYSGRATHIHLRARAYDAAGNTTYNYVTQLFFDDAFTDRMYLHSAYVGRGARNTRNSNDSIYRAAATPPLISAAESTSGVQASISLGLANVPLVANTASFSASLRREGSTALPTLYADLQVAAEDIGATGEIYLAAQANDRWYFHNGSSWVLVQQPGLNGFPHYSRGVLPATQSILMISGVDLSSLGPMTLLAGYGRDLLDMLENQRYAVIGTLN